MNIREDRLHLLSAAALNGMRRGIEKESLRVQPDGALALTRHPAALGSPPTHPVLSNNTNEAL